MKTLEEKQLDAAYGRLNDRSVKPVMKNGMFQRGYCSEFATVKEWRWNCTFGRWAALVVFDDGELRQTYAV